MVNKKDIILQKRIEDLKTLFIFSLTLSSSSFSLTGMISAYNYFINLNYPNMVKKFSAIALVLAISISAASAQ